MLHIKFGFGWPSDFRDILYYDKIHVYCPGVGADEPLSSNCFQSHGYLVLLNISCNIFHLNVISTISSIKCIDDLY